MNAAQPKRGSGRGREGALPPAGGDSRDPDLYRHIAGLPAGDLDEQSEARCRGALDAAAAGLSTEARLPSALRTSLVAAAARRAGATRPAAERRRPRRLVAALLFAAFVLGILAWRGWPREHPLSAQFRGLARLQERATDLRTAPLRGPDGTAQGAVEYSLAHREGWAVAEGLPPNDPAEGRYAIWIQRPEDALPRLCGRFDVADFTCKKMVVRVPLEGRADGARIYLTRSPPDSRAQAPGDERRWSGRERIIAEAVIGR
ncbi:MAG TPA: hypothetical protein PKC43_06855 [Phycisphaerales bacterium]|nr:hypothetical protein [Phycisphaerales bacterium]HMP37152.1 hypothetical protein [Phycisphaerales bacterium]